MQDNLLALLAQLEGTLPPHQQHYVQNAQLDHLVPLPVVLHALCAALDHTVTQRVTQLAHYVKLEIIKLQQTHRLVQAVQLVITAILVLLPVIFVLLDIMMVVRRH
jgi:hypothetical protein